MKEVTATEAARGFSSLLTSVEKDGETFSVTRGGRVIARITPAGGASGAAVKELIARVRPDAGWMTDLEQVRELLGTQERQWPA